MYVDVLMDLDTPVRKLRAFLAIGIIFCILQVFSTFFYVQTAYFSCRDKNEEMTEDNYFKEA